MNISIMSSSYLSSCTFSWFCLDMMYIPSFPIGWRKVKSSFLCWLCIKPSMAISISCLDHNNLYKVVISVFFVCSIITQEPWTNLPLIFIRELGRATEMCLAFEILSWVGRLLKIAKIVIYDQVQVNGGINFE